jgi:hypothetical protein
MENWSELLLDLLLRISIVFPFRQGIWFIWMIIAELNWEDGTSPL